MQKASKEYYDKTVVPELLKQLNEKSPMAVPRIRKVTINLGLGAAKDNKNLITEGIKGLTSIAGQKALQTQAHKAIAGFKIREGLPIGVMVTLRRDRMWSFLTRLVNVYLPRVKDFRGISNRSFDGQGNYSLGINDARVFPELGVQSPLKGLSVTIVMDSKSDDDSKKMLELLGLPFKK